jgi:hypothetical protein
VKAAAVAEGAVEEQAEEDAVPTAVGVADVAAEAPAVGVAEAAIDPAPCPLALILELTSGRAR